MLDGLSTRELVEVDLDAVAAIESEANRSPWPRQLFAQELALPPLSRYWLVAESGDDSAAAVVGFGGIMFASDTAHLMNLGVAPAHRRQGVASRLCGDLIAEARRRECDGLTLEVRASNTGARTLYERLGMTDVGTRPGYYPDGEDAHILWLHDLRSSGVGR